MPAPEATYVRNATFVKGVDGDSFYVRLDHGTYPTNKSEDTIEVRVKDLWCQETDDPDPEKKARGIAAKVAAELILTSASKIIVQTYKTKSGATSVGSFTRTVADVWVDGASFADLMIAAGHGTRMRLVGGGE